MDIIQRYALDGSCLDSPITLPTFVGALECELPNGLVGIDADGLAIVQIDEKKRQNMRIGRLLNKVGRSADEVKAISSTINVLVKKAKTELNITTSGQEVVTVYRNGPRSCMSNCDSVEVYDTEDVAVAYIVDENDRITARTVVCISPELGKQYVNIYGDSELMTAVLELNGFRIGSIEGCRLKRIEDCNGLMLPYLDDQMSVDDEGNFLRVCSGGDIDGSTQSGYAHHYRCDNCGEPVREDETCWSEYLGESMCECCFDAHHVYVDGQSYHTHDETIVELHDGSYGVRDDSCYSEREGNWYDGDEVTWVEHYEDYVPNEDAVYSETRGEYLLRDYATEVWLDEDKYERDWLLDGEDEFTMGIDAEYCLTEIVHLYNNNITGQQELEFE